MTGGTVTPPEAATAAVPPSEISGVGASPTLVSDSFHFSHYYWRSWDISSATPDDSNNNNDSDGGGSDSDLYKPKPIVNANEDIRLKFYHNVMGDGSNNIHFGKWDGIDVEKPDAYGKASEQMTDYMFELALQLQPHKSSANTLSFVDLGSGTGASAIRNASKHAHVRASCLNVCHAQNIAAQDLIEQNPLVEDRVEVIQGRFEDAPYNDACFDLCFSQDAFIHAVSKAQVYQEAYRITKPGGAFVFCDLMCGETSDLTPAEQERFAESNVLNDWLTPTQNVACLVQAGWKDVHWIDLTSDMRTSFELMQTKILYLLEHGHVGSNVSRVLLHNYLRKIKERLVQIDRGVFSWVVMHARKPVALQLTCQPPVPFVNTNKLIVASPDISMAEIPVETSVVVVDILCKMTRDKILALPPAVNLLITMSAGLDHIDVATCKERGITVQNSGRDAITSHVVQYGVALLTLGLRDAFSQIGVPFPSKGWNLNWNCQGKPLTHAKIAIVGMGMIAKELVRQVRLLAPETHILYYVPEVFRDMDAENKFQLEYYNNLEDMAAACDVLMPLCPLTKHTEHIVSDKVLRALRPDAGFINIARGKVTDTDALTAVLQEKRIKYAILDTTFPEPLPDDHPLWTTENCFILPHYATNTMAVREALVHEIQPLVEEFYGLGASDAKLKQLEKELRFDLAVAHRLTADLKWDMLTWNHISARFPSTSLSGSSSCLITPGRKLWSQVGPEDLVISSDNVTADIIHAAIYAARSDIGAIIHLHTPAATAVSCLEQGFVPMTQDAAYFYDKVANYEWDGVSDDASEGPLITKAVRDQPGCNTLLMHNHGFVCFGRTVKEAWVLAFYFERCCEVQLRVLQTGAKVRMPKPAVMKAAAESSYLPEFAPGACEWDALCASVTF